jgi:murein DD-endopeptidase MepM/ murein hydrolase activator NlpD
VDVTPAPSYRRFDLRSFFDHDTGSGTTIFTGDEFVTSIQGRSSYPGHSGYDIGAGHNELDTLAAAAGTIDFAGTESCPQVCNGGIDRFVRIAHDVDGGGTDFYTWYHHLGSIETNPREDRTWEQDDIIRVSGIAAWDYSHRCII